MAYEQKPNSGSLFKNDRKQQANHPDYKGNSKHQCPQCGHVFPQELGAWIKDLPRGGKVMSISFKPPRDRQPAPDNQPLRGIDPADVPPADTSDVPF